MQEVSQVALNGPTVDMPDGKPAEVKLSIVNLPTTRPIETMIQTGQTHTLVSGIIMQNGLTTTEVCHLSLPCCKCAVYSLISSLFTDFVKSDCTKF